MRVSNIQVILLVNLLKDTLGIAGQWGGMYPNQRLDLYNEILNQQSRVIVDLSEEEKQDGTKEV